MTRANTMRPKPGGEHSDDLESGYPKDTPSQGGGESDKGVGIKPSGSETGLEHAEYPDPGTGATGRPTAARALATPSKQSVGGIPAKGVIGDGRGNSGKFVGTMGGGQKSADVPYKGTSGCDR